MGISTNMKLALVHDWIGTYGGAERVLKELTRIWPDAPVYTLWADPRTVREHFSDTDIRVSGISRLPGIRRLYPYLAPFMPAAMEAFDLSEYDTVLSSSVIFAKGLVTRPGTRHFCYCYSPTRMLWDRAASYERHGIVSNTMRHAMRMWDQSAAGRPDQLIAISQTVADRIAKYYHRDAIVIPPPAHVTKFDAYVPYAEPGYFLAVGRLVPHKNFDVLIDAFHKLSYRLIVVGDGPLRRHLARRAGPNVTMWGQASDEELASLYNHCQAVIVANEEDFGLTAVEAMAHSKPVLALKAGGATETVIEGMTGEFFDDAIPESLADGVRRLVRRQGSYDTTTMQEQADKYSVERFTARITSLIC
jgi:glycosyltransferase involved in cell wall biosynthesis